MLLAAVTVAGRWRSVYYGSYSPGGAFRGVEVGGGVVVITVVSPEHGLPTGWHMDSSSAWEWGWFGNVAERMSWRWGFLSVSTPRTKLFGVSLLNVLGLVLVPTVLLWWARVCERRGTGRDHCAACGYDRKGLTKGAVCPECGTN